MLDAVNERQAYMRAVIATLQRRKSHEISTNLGVASARSSSYRSNTNNKDSDTIEPLSDGSTAVYVAAESGKSSEVLTLAELGADVHSANEDGWTPAIIAACNDQTKVIKILGQYDADLNIVDKNKDSAITIAAFNGCINALHTLAEYGADINQPDGKGLTPMVTAFMAGKREATVKLMQLGADPSQFVAEALRTDPEHPACMEYHDVFCRGGLDDSAPCGLTRVPDKEKNAIFTLVKLMSFCCVNNGNNNGLCTDMVSQKTFEADVAELLRATVSEVRVQKMFRIPYPIKRKVCELAFRLFNNSLKLDGDRITISVKVHRYTGILCLLLDKEMLKDTLALRVTCKTNNLNRRFPVFIRGEYHELEANLIESFVAFETSRFVETNAINAAIQLLS